MASIKAPVQQRTRAWFRVERIDEGMDGSVAGPLE